MNYRFISKRLTLKQITVMVLFLAASCMLNSCSIIRVVKVASPSADCAGSGQHFCHDTLVRASIWNGRKGKSDINCGCNNGISRVKVTTKPMDVVLGFLTAGFVVKQRIEWDCAQQDTSDDIHH